MSDKQKATPVLELAGERASRMRQRQRLIDACISALHQYGPSRTTVEKVVNIAKMSPGIVTFYFETKAAMLVAALEFLATEFEQRVMAPVTALKNDPVEALKLLIELYLDPDIASPRKVSVWYAFWGEGNSRREYFDLCGKKDDAFAGLVNELVDRIVQAGDRPHLDTDALALGLIGVLEVIWQGFAFQEEADIDRAAAKARCMAYLRSIFPEQFGPAGVKRAIEPAAVASSAANPTIPDSWQFAAHETAFNKVGDFVTLDLPHDRALIVRGEDGELRAFRNRCLNRPHAIARGSSGHFETAMYCAADGLEYGFDGRLQRAGIDKVLTPLPLMRHGSLVFTRLDGDWSLYEGTRYFEGLARLDLDNLVPVEVTETHIAAGWNVILEQWLGYPAAFTAIADPGHITQEILCAGIAWHASLSGRGQTEAQSLTGAWQRLLLYPNLLIDRYPGGASIIQLIADTGPQSGLRRLDYRDTAEKDGLGPLRFSANRLIGDWLKETNEIAVSTQLGMALPDDAHGTPFLMTPALTAFDLWLRQAADSTFRRGTY